MSFRKRLIPGVLLAAIALPAAAQVERSGNAQARVMQQLQQLTSERAALQVENTKLKQELEQAKQELQRSTSERRAAENRVKALTAAATNEAASEEQSQEQLERARAQLQELIAKFRETANTLRDVESDRSAVRSQLTAKERDLKTCVDRNAALYNLSSEVLDRMQNRGFWSSVTEREPFTKLKRVELENLIEDYKYRADELKLLGDRQVKVE